MTGNQTMDSYVRPWHLYSHSRSCTRKGLCRRLSRFVAFLIWYLLDRASVHEISSLMTWFQCMSDIFSHYGDLDPFYIFRFHGDHDPNLSILYVAMTTHVIFCIMPIHGHYTLMYPGLLHLLAVMCRVLIIVLYWLDDWFFHWVLHHSTFGIDL